MLRKEASIKYMLALMSDDTALNLASTQVPFEFSKRAILHPGMEQLS